MRESYQKESVGHECIPEHGPAYPSARALAPVQDLGYDECDDHPDEFVARIGHQVEQLAVVADVQYVGPKLQPQYLQQDDHEGGRCGQPHDFRVECAS